ncbi:MAG: SAM-dependent DNA methyltransferase, partial [Methanocalculus sp. MSAO_Arc2]
IATVFLDRCLAFCRTGGTVSAVMPQNWLFLKSYMKLRERLLKQEQWELVARLGEGGFHSSAAAGAFTILLGISHTRAPEGHLLCGLDVSEERDATGKARSLLDAEMTCVEQGRQLENPDYIIGVDQNESGEPLAIYAKSLAGIDSGDSQRFRFKFWEMDSLLKGWIRQLNSATQTMEYSGREHILFFEDGKGALSQCPGASIRNIKYWGKQGVSISRMRNIPASLSIGESWDRNCACIIPKNNNDLYSLWTYCSSQNFITQVRRLNQKLSVSEATFENIPFDLDHWTKVAEEQYPHGLPDPYSDDPTQWLFHGHPCGSVIWDEETKQLAHGPIRTDGTVLHVAIARLLGYRWPAETDSGMELAAEAREWVQRCDALLPFADDDGIAGIPSLRGEGRLVDRLRALLAAAYGTAWSPDVENELLRAAGYTKNDGRLRGDLEGFLRDEFFASHSQLFHHRPFIWQLWDGRADGFSVLLNYHKLDRRNLERLIYTYLGGWITQQRSEVAAATPGAEERLVAALDLKGRLEKILEGEKPYDIFIRWK